MVTKQSPTSLRIPELTRVRVEKWAAEQGIPKNAAYVQLIERGLAAAGPHPGLNERPLKRRANDDSKLVGALQEAVAGNVTERKPYTPRPDTWNKALSAKPKGSKT